MSAPETGSVSVVLELDVDPLMEALEDAASRAWGLEVRRSLRILADAIPKANRPVDRAWDEAPVVTAGDFVWGSVVSNA